MSEWLGRGGQRVVVAGGGGTLGAAVVAGFLDAGATVGVLDLKTDGVDTRVTAKVAADLSEAGAAHQAMLEVREQLGGMEVFVHCVGVIDRRPLEAYAATDWDCIIAVNLTSAFHTAREAARGMRDQRYGRILFFSSVAGRSGHKYHGPYAATNQLMRVLAREYAEHGVTATAVAPGYMDTELTRQYLSDHPDKRQALVELIPAGRFGTQSEVADPVLFLCSPRASFITG